MSGTSLDGIDAAIINTDGERILAFGPRATFPYDEAFRELLRGVLGVNSTAATTVSAVALELTIRHAEAVRQLLADNDLASSDIDVIGFHGHTIFHRPAEGVTRQIGDGGTLARETGIQVVCDFRSRDVAEGGEGAPLAPLFHAALAEGLDKPVAVLNIGGVANVTWIGYGSDETSDITAFDTGPGNALVDDWTRTATGQPMDEDGLLAAAGTVDEATVHHLLTDQYFERRPPKSLDRDHFSHANGTVLAKTPEDGAATLAAFTAAAVARAYRGRIAELLGYYEHRCAIHRIDYALCTTDTPLEEKLVDFLSRRARAAAGAGGAIGGGGP